MTRMSPFIYTTSSPLIRFKSSSMCFHLFSTIPSLLPKLGQNLLQLRSCTLFVPADRVYTLLLVSLVVPPVTATPPANGSLAISQSVSAGSLSLTERYSLTFATFLILDADQGPYNVKNPAFNMNFVAPLVPRALLDFTGQGSRG